VRSSISFAHLAAPLRAPAWRWPTAGDCGWSSNRGSSGRNGRPRSRPMHAPATGQVTSDIRRKPFQLARGAIRKTPQKTAARGPRRESSLKASPRPDSTRTNSQQTQTPQRIQPSTWTPPPTRRSRHAGGDARETVKGAARRQRLARNPTRRAAGERGRIARAEIAYRPDLLHFRSKRAPAPSGTRNFASLYFSTGRSIPLKILAIPTIERLPSIEPPVSLDTALKRRRMTSRTVVELS